MNYDYLERVSLFLSGNIAVDYLEEIKKVKDEIDRLKKSLEILETHWMKTTETLPDYNGWFLCAVIPNIYGFEKYDRQSKDCIISQYENGWKHKPLFNTITHWMPLPEPPKND